MGLDTRRQFNARLLGSLMTYGLIETVYQQDILADSVKPVIHKWLVDLTELATDLKGKKLKDTEFQAKLEELYKRVNLPELVKFLELDRVADRVRFPQKGAANLGVNLRQVEGLPPIVFGKQIFACKKDRSIVPHGHENMCTGFIVLRGSWHGRHFDRVEDNADHYLMKPTINHHFKPGECSTVSDSKDNVHWFKAESETAFIFNIHVLGYNPKRERRARRVYVDPEGEKTKGGLIVAKKMSSSECHRKYG